MRRVLPALVVLLLGLALWVPAAAPATAAGGVPSPANSYAVFALSRACGGQHAALTWSGSGLHVVGGVHSNGDLDLTGNGNHVSGAVTYGCAARLPGHDNSFGAAPSRTAPEAAPVNLSADDFSCDYTPPNGDLDAPGPWWVGGDATSLQLEPGVYCTAGPLTLATAGVSGQVTFVASGPEGAIHITGANFDLSAYTSAVLAYAEGSDSAIALDGSGGTWMGVLLAPQGQVKLSGANLQSPGGLIIGNTVSLTGSAGTLNELILPSQGAVQTGTLQVQAAACDVSAPPANFDWHGQCTRPASGVPLALAPANNSNTAVRTTETTGENGKATFASLPPGLYQLNQTSGGWCHAESDSVDAKGNLRITAGQTAQVWIFECAGA